MSFPTITTKSKNFEITAGLEEKLEKRFSTLARLLPKGNTDVLCEVELEKITEHHQAGKIYRAEVNLSFGGQLLRAEAVEESMDEAIDRVKSELKRELEKTHSRTESLVRRGARRAKAFLRL